MKTRPRPLKQSINARVALKKHFDAQRGWTPDERREWRKARYAQVLAMHRVERVFHDLQPVARHYGPPDISDHIVAHKRVPARH